MAIVNYDVRNTEPDSGRPEPMPKGVYTAYMMRCELKDTAAGGQRYACAFKIVDPAEFAGRVVYAGFNTVNSSAVAQKIGREQMAALFHATGKVGTNDTDEMLGIPLLITLKITPASGNYDAKNDITVYKALNTATAPMATRVPTSSVQASLPPRAAFGRATFGQPKPANTEESHDAAPAPAQSTATTQTVEVQAPWDKQAVAPPVKDDDIPF